MHTSARQVPAEEGRHDEAMAVIDRVGYHAASRKIFDRPRVHSLRTGAPRFAPKFHGRWDL